MSPDLLDVSPFSMLEIKNLGLISYSEGREIQSDLVSKRQQNLIPDTFVLCEHPPTLTAGIRATEAELLIPVGERKNIEIVKTNRGGEWTAHEPGQLVLYPVIDIKPRKFSPKCFVNVLLDTVCAALKEVHITAVNSIKPAGVFVETRKIGSIGLKISRGVTNHGVSLNVSNSLELFKLIVPCGLADIEVTSVSKELGKIVETSSIIPIVEEQLVNSFGD